MDSHARVVVIGGGVFGVSAALALARRGHSHVELLERGRVGSANTALAAGVVSLQTWNDEDAALIARTRARIHELVAWARTQELPAAGTVWSPVGGLTIATAPRRGVLEAMRDRIVRLGGAADVLGAEDAARRFPRLRFASHELVLHGRDDGYVASTDLTDLARRWARALGVRVREEARVDRVECDGGRVDGVAIDGVRQRADVVVVAGGAWTRDLLERSGVRIPALPYRSQLCALEAPRPPEVVVHDTVHGFYARPESSHRFLAGDGTELRPFDPDAFDPRASPAFLESIATAVLARLPDADVRLVNGWAGLCVGTPDRRPLAGSAPGVEGLFVLTGDNGFGVMRGLALGEVVAARVEGRHDPQSEGVDPARFGADPPADFPLSEGFSLPD